MLLWMLLGLLHAQNYAEARDYFSVAGEHFSVKDGLPSQVIYAVLQDRRGFLWIATDAGLSRYDGRSFVNFTTKDGLGDNEILDLYEDKKGRIWFKPFTGRLSYFYNNIIYGDHNDPVLAAIKGEYLSENILCEDAAGGIYIPRADSLRIAVINPDHTLHYLDLSEKLKHSKIQRLLSSDSKKHLYCQTYDNRMINIHTGVSNTLSPYETKHIFFTTFSSRAVLYMNDNGLYSITNDSLRLLIPSGDLRLDNSMVTHTDILMDAYRNIWICNSKNSSFFYLYSEGRYKAPIPVFEGMPGVFSFDRENNIWIFDKRNGLYKIPFDRLLDRHTRELNKQLLEKQVTCCFTDSRGNLWLGYNNGWVSKIKQNQAEHFDLNTDTRRSNRVIQVAEDKQGVLWFAMDGTLSAIAPSSLGRPHILYHDKYMTNVKHVFTDADGNAYCARAYRENICRLSIKHGQIDYSFYNTRGDFRSFSGFFSKDHILYTGEITGLKRIENGNIQLLYRQDPRLKARVQHFAENLGVIFLATYNNGLIALKKDKIVATTGSAGHMPGITCRRIYIRHDTLYVATNAGIQTLVFESNTFRFLRNITLSDGLLSNDVYDLCFSGDTLYTATSEGISVLKLPLKPWIVVKPTPVSILGFMAGGKAYATDKPVGLSYGQRNIRVSFVAPVMDKPVLLQYRYRFANRDKSWIVTTGNSIEYSDLSFGTYRLEIQAKKYNSTWSEPAVIQFTVYPPWYKTLWFLGLLAVAAFIIAYVLLTYIIRWRVRRTLREREVVEKERSRIAAELHDDIGADLTSLVMLSGMMKSKQQLPPLLIDKLESSSNGIINKMNEIIWMLNTANDNMAGLVAYLNRYAEGYLESSGLRYTITIGEEVYSDTEISSELRRNLFLVYKEALHNTVKHAGADSVDIRIFMDEKLYLYILICDDGKGFRADLRQEGNGLVNMNKRVTAVQGTLTIKSEPGKGCLVEICVPNKR